MIGRKGRAIVAGVVVAETQSNLRIRQNGQTIALHVAAGVVEVGRSRNDGGVQNIRGRGGYRIEICGSIPRRRRRIIWIGQQRVVPEVLVMTERSVEHVPLVLADPQEADDIGIPAVAEVVEVQTIKKGAAMIE